MQILLIFEEKEVDKIDLSTFKWNYITKIKDEERDKVVENIEKITDA